MAMVSLTGNYLLNERPSTLDGELHILGFYVLVLQ